MEKKEQGNFHIIVKGGRTVENVKKQALSPLSKTETSQRQGTGEVLYSKKVKRFV